MFYSESRRPNRITQPKTSEYEPEYEEHIDTKTGKKYLKQVGKTNVYEKIQEAAEGVTLAEIIQRYGINPAESAEKLESSTGEILDYTNTPKNLMEALEISNQAKNIFEHSAHEIKSMFNNNFTEFLAAANDGSLKKKLEEFKPKTQDMGEIPTEINTTSSVINKVETKPTQVTTGVKYE